MYSLIVTQSPSKNSSKKLCVSYFSQVSTKRQTPRSNNHCYLNYSTIILIFFSVLQAAVETSPSARSTTSNPLNKLRNRNRLQVQPKTTTKSPLPLAIRRSPLLPRRKVTETPAVQSSQEETASEEETTLIEIEPTEAIFAETSTAASTKHEETRGLSGLLAPRRRIPARRPGQIVTQK